MLSDRENLNQFTQKAFKLAHVGDYSAAHKLMQRAHTFVHRKGGLHVILHTRWFKLAWQSRKLIEMLKQVLPIIFAIPVSLVHRYFNLSLKSEKRKLVS